MQEDNLRRLVREMIKQGQGKCTVVHFKDGGRDGRLEVIGSEDLLVSIL